MKLARTPWTLFILAALVLLGCSFLFGGPRSMVAWDRIRAVALESDDWGLVGFVPAADSWEGLDRSNLETGRFPEVYWLSTLESSQDVQAVNQVLARHLGADGHPAILQPNYIMSSLEYSEDRWLARDLPDLPPAYARPGLWDEVRTGIRNGTWYPELHGNWHYDPAMRRETALADDLAREVTSRNIMLFPGSEQARELGAWRTDADLAAELDHCLEVFEGLFGRRPGSVIAPDYHWSGRNEDLWSTRNLKVIQGKREQINPAFGGGRKGRLAKYVLRHWDRWYHPDRCYLERNCRLETAQAAAPSQVVAECTAATRRAWANGRPAIVETHRVNFVHLDTGVGASGLESLDSFLEEITSDGRQPPVFVTGMEIAQLSDRGTSWCVRGDKIVVRNATGARRVVVVPGWAVTLARGTGLEGSPGQAGVLVAVPASSTVDLVP